VETDQRHSAIDRRRTTRHPVKDNLARLEWAEGGEFRDAEVRLLDIGQGGVGFLSAEPPPVGRHVWVRLEEPTLTGWVSAKVVKQGKPLEAGLCFCGYCPFQFFEAAASRIGFDRLN
jgi:hypothetical protein